jgi:hypothetical protein
MKLWTARYQNKAIPTSGLAPIRITLGHPRFKLSYELGGTLLHLASSRSYFGAPRPIFTEHYREDLDHLGVNVIRSELETMSERNGGKDLVLCCFEDVRLPGTFCHRQLFST